MREGRHFCMYALVLAVAAGCSGGKEKDKDAAAKVSFPDEVTVISISTDKVSDLDREMKVAQTVEFDEDVENFIGMPGSIVVRGDTIYAIDPVKAPGIYAYLKDGTQLFAYCHEGNGPEDVGSPFCLKVTDTEVSAFDNSGKGIIVLDKKGHFVRRVPLPDDLFDVTGAMLDGEGYWMDYANRDYNDTKLAWSGDSTGTQVPVLTVPPHLKGFTMIGLQVLIDSPDGSVLYIPCLEPRAYRLRDGKASLCYELDFNGLWPSDEDIRKDYGGRRWARKVQKFPVQGIEIYETPKYVVVGFKNDDKRYVTVYDRASRRSAVLLIDGEKYYTPMYATDDELYILRKDGDIDIFDLSEFEMPG